MRNMYKLDLSVGPLKILFTIFLFTPLYFYAQNIPELSPSFYGDTINKSYEGEIAQIELARKCEKFWDDIHNKFSQGYIDEEKFTQEEKNLYHLCHMDVEDYWSVIGYGCSWYCGGGQDTNSASSELKSFKKISYAAKNIHDLSYKSAWIEGVDGYGIGEFVVYHFPPQTPRITTVIVVNGYVKTDKSWKENSRVKKLKMYVNGEAFAILNLDDSKVQQYFSFKPIGIAERSDWDALKKMDWWTMKFEILEVYPGEKFDDTAITEIYFDGIDVH